MIQALSMVLVLEQLKRNQKKLHNVRFMWNSTAVPIIGFHWNTATFPSGSSGHGYFQARATELRGCNSGYMVSSTYLIHHSGYSAARFTPDNLSQSRPGDAASLALRNMHGEALLGLLLTAAGCFFPGFPTKSQEAAEVHRSQWSLHSQNQPTWALLSNETNFPEMYVHLNPVLFLMIGALSIKQVREPIHRPSSPPNVVTVFI